MTVGRGRGRTNPRQAIPGAPSRRAGQRARRGRDHHPAPDAHHVRGHRVRHRLQPEGRARVVGVPPGRPLRAATLTDRGGDEHQHRPLKVIGAVNNAALDTTAVPELDEGLHLQGRHQSHRLRRRRARRPAFFTTSRRTTGSTSTRRSRREYGRTSPAERNPGTAAVPRPTRSQCGSKATSRSSPGLIGNGKIHLNVELDAPVRADRLLMRRPPRSSGALATTSAASSSSG